MIAGHTKFAPDRLFALVAKKFYSSDVFNQLQLINVYEQHSTVTFNDGGIVRSWRDLIAQKYANLPGIHSLHNFLALKNPGVDAVMKVRDECYTGVLKNSLMRLEKGYKPVDVALPRVSDSYVSRGRVRAISDTKLTHLKQMCSNFIPEDQWHEILKQ